MFQELKKCKTLKEIYTLLGTKPFEKCALILLILWCLLPIYAAIDQIYWGFFGEQNIGKYVATIEDYKWGFQVIGSITLLFSCFYIIGRLAINHGQILKKIKSEPWHFILLTMLFWSCICASLSADFNTSFNGTFYRNDGLKSYFYYAGMYVCAFIVMNSRYRKIVYDTFVIIADVVGLIVILQNAEIPIILKCFYQEPRSAMFFQHNHTGYFLNMAVACVIGMYIFENKCWKRIYNASTLAFLIYALIINSTFTSYIASCCALVMIIVFYVRKYHKFTWKFLTPILIIIGISTISYLGFMPNSSGEDMRTNLSELTHDTVAVVDNASNAVYAGHGRMFLWQQGIKMIQDSPIFGYGPEQINEKYTEGMWSDRSSNEFIQYAVFLGIPGLLLYLVALITLFIRQWLCMRKLDDTTLIAAGCVIAYLVSSMFGNTMFYTVPYFYMFLAMATGRNLEKSEK